MRLLQCVYTLHTTIFEDLFACTDLTALWLELSGARVSQAAATLDKGVI